jgi:hypothetical protein
MRKSIVSAATALAVVATGLAATGIVLADRPAAAALSDVPEDCFVTTAAYRADGQRLTYQVSFGTPSYQTYPNDILDWVPSAQQQVGATADETTFTRTDYAARPSDGRLVSVEGPPGDGWWSRTVTSGGGFGGGGFRLSFGLVKEIAAGPPSLEQARLRELVLARCAGRFGAGVAGEVGTGSSTSTGGCVPALLVAGSVSGDRPAAKVVW